MGVTASEVARLALILSLAGSVLTATKYAAAAIVTAALYFVSGLVESQVFKYAGSSGVAIADVILVGIGAAILMIPRRSVAP